MAGARDTEASFQVDVNGIDKLTRLNEAFDKTVATAEKADAILSRGLNIGGGAGQVGKFNSGLREAEKSAQSLNKYMSQVLARQKEAGASSDKYISSVERSSRAYSQIATQAEKVAQAQNKTAETASRAEVAQNRAAEAASRAQTAAARQAEMQAKIVTAQSKAAEATIKASNAQEKETAAISRSVAQAEKLAAAREKDLALASKYNAQARTTSALGAAAVAGSALHGGAQHKEGRVSGAVKEGLAMFAPSMLIAGGVIKAAEGIKELFKSGVEYNSQVSGMKGTWQTLVDGAIGEGISRKTAGSAGGIVKGIRDTSRITGRSLELVDEGYQQMYHATESESRTKKLVHSEMMIADAMNLSDAQASRFAMYGVGHSLDRGKVTGGSLNQMVQYAPALTNALKRAVLASDMKKNIKDVTEHDIKSSGIDLRERIKGGEVSAKMLEDAINYLGGTKFKKAAENAQMTIPGMVRAIKNGSGRIMGEFENSFAKPLAKNTSSFFGGITKYVLSTKSTEDARKLGSQLAGITAKVGDGLGIMTNAAIKMWNATKDFRGGFSKGFVNELTTVKNAVQDAGNFISGVGQKIANALPKGTREKAKDLGELTGKVAAFLLVMRGASHLPVVGKVFDGMLGSVGKLAAKIPVIGGLLEKIIGGNRLKNDSAANKMVSASNTMMAAANKMLGGGSGTGGAGGFGGRAVSGSGKATLGNKLANSKFGAVVDKTFLTGAGLAAKGGIRGAIGNKMMKGALFATEKGLGGASSLARFGSSGLGRLLGGIGKVGGGIARRGGLGINALFAGFDVYQAMKNNAAGSKARHVGVGAGIGGGIGGTLGAALGSFLGPLGTIGGGMAGSWAGNKLGGWIGGMFSSNDKPKPTRKLVGPPKPKQELIGPKKPKAEFGRSSSSKSPLLKGLEAEKQKAKSTSSAVKKESKSTANARKKDSADVLKASKKNDSALLASAKKTSASQAKLSKESLSKIKKSSEAASKGQKKAAESAAKAAVSAQKKAAKETLSSMKKQGSDLQKALKKQSSGQKKELNAMKKSQSSALKSMNKDAQNSFKKFTKLAKDAMKNGTKAIKSGIKTMNRNTKSGLKPIENQFKKLTTMVKSNLKKAQNASKSGTKGITNAVKNGLKNVGKSGKSEFNKLTSSIKSGMNKAKSTARSGARAIGTAIKSGLKPVGNAGKAEFNRLASSVRSGMNKAKSSARSGARGIVTSIRSGLKTLNSVGRSSMNGFANTIKSQMNKAASAARSGSNKIVSNVKSGLSKLSSSASSSMSKLTSTITNGLNKAANAAKSSANKIASSLQSGLNKAVSYANSATSRIASSMNKIGSSAASATAKVNALARAINSLKSKTVTITANIKGKGADKLEHGTSGARSAFSSVPNYAGGTRTSGGHRGGMALVNDAKGSNYREAFMLPNGVVGLFPKKRNFLTVLPRGAHVLNAEDTRRKFGSGVSQYARGTVGALEAINATQARKSITPPTKSVSIKMPDVNITVNIQNAGAGVSDDIAKNLKPQIKQMFEEFLRNYNSEFKEVPS